MHLVHDGLIPLALYIYLKYIFAMIVEITDGLTSPKQKFSTVIQLSINRTFFSSSPIFRKMNVYLKHFVVTAKLFS